VALKIEHRGRGFLYIAHETPPWTIHRLPPNALELNPVEQLWTYFKYGRLARFAP